MPVARLFPDPRFQPGARRLPAIGEPMRIWVLDRRRAEPHRLGALAETTPASRNVFKLLSTVHEAGVVSRRTVVDRAIGAIADRAVSTRCRTVSGNVPSHDAEFGLSLEHATGSSRAVR